MLCTEEMGTLLSRYVDGELADKEKKSLELHLETCASCRDILNLFQRNDNVLNNALVGEAFGAETVDAVMTEIRRLEEPMVVAPAMDEEPAPAPVAMRQVIQVTRMWPFAAAAALMIACLGGFVAVAKYGGFGTTERQVLQDQIQAMQNRTTETSENNGRITQGLIDRIRDLDREMKDQAVRSKLEAIKDPVALAYVNGHSIVVRANYATDKFFPFQVFRARETTVGKFGDWEQLALNLPTPFYRDETAQTGVNYLYQIRAIYRDTKFEKFVDSAPMLQSLPLAGGVDPNRSLRVRFVAALPDLSQATFEVSRTEGQKLISRYFNVKVGEPIGGVEKVDGKDINLTTRYTLQSIVRAEEILGSGTGVVSIPTRKATMKADSKAKDLSIESFSLLLEGEQYVPPAR